MRVYAKGDRVSQAQYGPGTVMAANEYHTTIDFDQHGLRTFATPIVTLESTNEPAPARPKKSSRSKRAGRRVGPHEVRQAPGPTDA